MGAFYQYTWIQTIVYYIVTSVAFPVTYHQEVYAILFYYIIQMIGLYYNFEHTLLNFIMFTLFNYEQFSL